MLKAAIYARFSSEMQDTATIQTQLSECRDKAKALGAVVVQEYFDEERSARTDERPDFQRLLLESKAKPRPFDIVLVRKFDRFARNAIHARLSKEALSKRGIRVISVHEDIDTSTASGWMMENVIDLFSEWYSRNLAVETKSGMTTNTKRGFRCGGTAPYGYKNKRIDDPESHKVRTVLVINDAEAETVRLIFSMFASGSGFGKIINEIEKRNIKPRKAAVWQKPALSMILRNDVYRGVLIWRQSPNPTTWVRNEGAVPAIIDADTWARVEARLKLTKKANRRSETTEHHPLTGMAFCQKCGSPFGLGQKTDGVWRLVCLNHRAKKGCPNGRTVIETALVNQVVQVMLDRVLDINRLKEAILKKGKQDAGAQDKIDTAIAKQQRRIGDLAAREARLVGELALGEMPRAAIRAGLESIEQEKKAAIVRLAELETTLEKTKTFGPTSEDIELWAEAVRQDLEMASFERLRQKFRQLGIRVNIGEKTGLISANPAISDGVLAIPLSAQGGTQNVIAINPVPFILPGNRFAGRIQKKIFPPKIQGIEPASIICEEKPSQLRGDVNDRT